MGRHVLDKKQKPEKKFKGWIPGIQLCYNEVNGLWSYDVNSTHSLHSSYAKYQTWYDAERAAWEAWDGYYPGSPCPPAVKCFTYEEFFAAIKKLGRK